MKRRPWPILVLALIQLLAPIGNIIVSALLSGVTLQRYLEVQIRHNSLSVFLFESVGLALISSVALYAIKSWSYPVFFLSTLYTSGLSLAAGWRSYQAQQSGAVSGIFMALIIIGALALNLSIGAYLLLPRVRKIFFNRTLRWWESLPRYPLPEVTGSLFLGQIKDGKTITVVNVSYGGAMIESNEPLQLAAGTAVVLRFSCQNLKVQADGLIVYHRPSQEGLGHGYGIRFNNVPEGAAALLKNQLHLLFQRLEKRGISSIHERTGLFSDLIYWTSKLIMRIRMGIGTYAYRSVVPGDDGERG